MAKSVKSRKSLRSVDNTGFSDNAAAESTRLINRDGNANLRKTGIPFYKRISIYHSLLKMSRWKFMTVVFAFYTVTNMSFALIYYLIGVEHMTGTEEARTQFQQFQEAFFFSAQSLTTVGYGRLAPLGPLTSFLATFESLIGIMSFALATGIFYGRFSRPRAYLMFSDNMIIAPYKGGRALMFRLVSFKNNHLTDLEAQLNLAMRVMEDGKRVTRFYPVKLEISKITSLALNWTIVHAINEESPLFGLSEEEITDSQLEVIVNIKGFDDHFSNTVQQRTSYTFRELVVGAKYVLMYNRPEGSSQTVLDLQKLNEFERVTLPHPEEVPETIAATA